MKTINWKPDKKGVPMCMAQLGKPCPRGRAHPDECTMDPDSGDDGMCYDGCYPQMAKQSAALAAFMEWNSGPDAGMENSAEVWNSVVEQIIEAVSP